MCFHLTAISQDPQMKWNIEEILPQVTSCGGWTLWTESCPHWSQRKNSSITQAQGLHLLTWRLCVWKMQFYIRNMTAFEEKGKNKGRSPFLFGLEHHSSHPFYGVARGSVPCSTRGPCKATKGAPAQSRLLFKSSLCILLIRIVSPFVFRWVRHG